MSMKLLTTNTACLIQRMTEHAAQDQIIQGTGWENGKGCFVGCCLHKYQHSLFPLQLGWPEPLAHLCDSIFEALPNVEAKQFAVDVPNAVGVDGKDLSMIVPQWIYWTLSAEGSKPTAYPQFQPFIDVVTAIYREWTETGVRPSRDLADRADRAYLAYRADLADRANRAYRADMADLAYRADRADRADLADMAYLAYLAYLADLADMAYLAYLADYRTKSAAKLIELLKAAPIVSA